MKNYFLYIVLIFLSTNLFAQWESDRKLSTAEVNAQTNENNGQCIAVSGNVVHVVWADAIGGSGIYYKRSTNAGVTWGPDTRLTASPSISDLPSIAVVGNNVHVAYRDSTPSAWTSNYIRSTDGGITWGSPISLGNYNLMPSIAAYGTYIYVALNILNPGNSEIWCRRSTNNGTSWEPAVQISNAAGRPEGPSISTFGAVVHIAWNDSRTDTMQTFYRRSTDFGATWGPEIQRTHSPVLAIFPSVSVSGADVDLVWDDGRFGNYEIYHLRSSDFGANWGTEERLSFDALSSLYPNLVRSGSHLHVAWTGGGLFYKHSSDGGTTWENPVPLVNAASQPTLSFIAVTGNVVHVIWTDSRDGHKAIYYKRNPTGNAAPPSNTITVSSAPAQLCTGASFQVGYQVTGMFFDDNVFTAQLSDGIGRFTNPIDIGTLNSKNSGTINAFIPFSVTPASGYRIRVNSSSPPATGEENDFDISLNNHPTPSIQGMSLVCQNSSQTFSTPFTAGNSYKWTITGGSVSGLDTQRTIIVNWNTSNTFGKVSLKETIINTGCSDTVSKIITFIPHPTPNIQGPIISCRNNYQTFSTNAVTGHLYKWTVDGGSIVGPDDRNTLLVEWATIMSSGTITLVETVDIYGCTGSDKHYVDINPVPRPLITGSINTCNKSTENYSTFNTKGNSYLWRVIGGTILGEDNKTDIQVNWNTSNSSGTVTLVETTDSTGCSDSTSIKVTVNPGLIIGISGPMTVKKGSTRNYSGQSSGILSYKWNVTGGIIWGVDNLKDVSVVWGTQKTGTIKLTCMNSNGCIDSLQKNISIGNSSIGITGSEIVCEQSDADYATPFISGTTNEWTAIGGSIEGSNSDTIVQVKWGNAGNGSLILIQTVDATQHKDTAKLDIAISALPQVSIIGADTVVIGRQYTYIASPTDGTYQWEAINGTIIGSTTNRVAEIKWKSNNNCIAKVTETNIGGCIDSASLDMKLMVSSVQDNSRNSYFLKVYPNPSSGIINIEFFNNEPDNFEIEITNVYGITVRKIYSRKIGEEIIKTVWDGTDSNSNKVFSGVYFVIIKSKSFTVSEKFVLIN